MTHLRLPIEHEHFARWLELFEKTAKEVLPASLAAMVVDKAERMAVNFKLGISLQKEKLGARRGAVRNVMDCFSRS